MSHYFDGIGYEIKACEVGYQGIGMISWHKHYPWLSVFVFVCLFSPF